MSRRPSHYATYAPSLLDMDLVEPGKTEPVDIKPFMNNPWFSLGVASFEPKAEAGAPSAAPSAATSPAPHQPAFNDDSCSSAFEPDENSSYFQFFRGKYLSSGR